MAVDTLQLFSFIIDEKTVDQTKIYIFKLPSSVENAYNKIGQSKNNSPANKTIFKVASCYFPEIIHCNNRISDINKDRGNWFYSLRPFDLNILKTKICEWLQIEYRNRLACKLEEQFTEEWCFEEPIPLNEIVNERSSVIYSLIPNYYNYLLAEKEFNFECLNKNLVFHRVIGESKATLLTDPIQLEGKKYSPFSYMIQSKLIAPIDDVGLCLNFWLHIKRWESKALLKEIKNKDGEIEKRNYITGKEDTSLFIYKENPYYDNDAIVFNKVSLERDNQKVFRYSDTADELYSQLLEIDLSKFPYKDTLNKGEENEIIYVSHKNKGKILTQPGAGLPERNEMLKIISDNLPKLKLRAPIEFLDKPSNTKLANIAKVMTELNALDIQPQYIIGNNKKISKYAYAPNNQYKSFKLFIASDTKDLYDKVVEVCTVQLRLEKIDTYRFVNEEGTIFNILPVSNAFATTLKDDRSDRNERREQIEECFGKQQDKELRLAIIDLPNYSLASNVSKNEDPKNFIRNTCRKNKILTQFIDYQDNKIVIEQVVNTVKDILSAAGFMEDVAYQDSLLSTNDQLVGIAKISTGKNDNVLGMCKIERGKMMLNIFGINKWMSIQDYIFSLDMNMLSKMKIKTFGKEQQIRIKNEIDNWIRAELAKILESENRVYAYVDYSLRQNLWAGAKNEDFKKFDTLLIPNKENLRMVRINGGDEIPEYYICTKQGNCLNKNSGIFKGINNTYYLVGKRSETDQIKVTTTKCDDPTKPLKRQALQEINIQGCINEEDRDRVAILSQILRGLNISYDNHTALPLPLYAMGRLTEYIKAMSE